MSNWNRCYFGVCGTFASANRCFYSCPILFFCKGDECEKGGGGFHINLSIHPFHSPKRLRLQWRDRGYKATRNPPNAAKKSSPNSLGHLYSQNSGAELPFCPPKLVIPATVYLWCSVEGGQRLSSGVTLKKLLAHLVYFLPPHSSSTRLNSITCFPSNSWTQELNSLFGGKCLQECGHTTEKKVLWLTIHKNVRPFFNGGTKKCENFTIWARYKKQTQVFVCPLLRIICDQFLTTGLLNTSVSISGASDSCCCPLPGCPLSAKRWRVGGFLWCHTRSWHFSPGWQSDPGAWWQSEVELEEEKHEAWIPM